MEPSIYGKQIINSIKWIKNKTDNTNLDLALLSLNCDCIEKNLHHFRYNNEIIRRKNKFLICYNCVNCQRENIISLNNLISKIDRNKISCHSCTSILLQNFSDIVNKSSLSDKIINDGIDFSNMDDDFKDSYLRKNISVLQFELIRNSIISFQDDKFLMNMSFRYIPFFRNNPGIKSFEPMLYDSIRDTIEKPMNFKLECNHCGYHFKSKKINQYRNKPFILCKKCETDFSPTKLKDLNNVHYKTKFQHKFLKLCLKNQIKCENGPVIYFSHNNGQYKKCQIHYYLSDHKVFLDVVGNKEFQCNDNNRTTEIKRLAHEQNCKYIQLYPKNYMKVIKFICKVQPKPQYFARPQND